MSATELTHDTSRPAARRATGAAILARLAPWLLIAGLVLFYAVNNWQWLATNVTSTGWDKSRHLSRSLLYTQLLSHPSIQSLFTVVVSDPIREWPFPASAAIVYWLFGRTDDVAVMVNILYLLFGLAATYGIGRRWGGRAVGLTAVALLASFPMFYSMSRYFYMEFALTALMAVTVYLLASSDGFKRRGRSVLFGLAFGLTLLEKRTSVVFLFGPIAAAVLVSGLLPMLWRRIRSGPRVRLPLQTVGLALILGLVPVGLWYWPNREAVRGLYLGDALFFIWWALAALAAYFLLLPSAPLSNALSACFLGLGVASTWYLAHVNEYVQRVTLYGYGVNDPRGRKMMMTSLSTYLYYIRKLGNEHLSILVFVVFLLVVLAAGVVVLRRQGRLRTALRRLRPEAWLVVAWLGGGYLFLTLSIYQETRAITPVLPAAALLFAAALFKLPWRRVTYGLIAAVLLFGLVQYLVVSYEPVYRLLTPGYVQVPGWGRTSVLAQGVYIQLPDEGKTDSGYAIQPDVLRRVEERRAVLGRDRLDLGLLVNTSQINAGPFNYLMLTRYPNLRVESFIERFNTESPYRELFGKDYLAVKRVNAGMNAVQKELIRRLLDEPPALFSEAFELETSYVLPDRDTVYLYRQRSPLPVGYHAEYIAGLAEQLGARTRAGDAILVTPAELLAPFVAHYSGPADVYLAPGNEAGWTEWHDAALLGQHYDRAFLVVGDPAAGRASDVAEPWLDEHAFWAAHEWAGSVQLLTYGLVDGEPAAAPTAASGVTWDGQLELAGFDLPNQSWEPGDVVPLTLFWHRQAPAAADYAVFVHVAGLEDRVIAQNDSQPAGGLRPTSTWQAGETIVDRHGVLLPADMAPGRYEVAIGVYPPATGARLAAAGAAISPGADRVWLGPIYVGQDPRQEGQAGGPHVAFVGDSLTRGNSSTGNVGFVGMASKELDWQPSRYVWFHVQESVERLSEVGRPDIIVLQVGIHAVKGCDDRVTNDPAAFRTSYAQLLDNARQLAPRVIAINIPWLNWGEKRTAKAKVFNAIIGEEAAARGIPVVDAWALTEACGPACISEDGIHPNDRGHQGMADALVQVWQNR